MVEPGEAQPGEDPELDAAAVKIQAKHRARQDQKKVIQI
jgi:hypothetical protein